VERPEIVELHFSALTLAHDVEPLSPFLSQRVEWILSAADPQTSGDESPSNAIRFSGKDGLRELALYFPDRLNVISGDLTGCITHHHLFFALEESDCDLLERGNHLKYEHAGQAFTAARHYSRHVTSTPASSCLFHSEKTESNRFAAFDASHSPRYFQETGQSTSVVVGSGSIRLCVIVRTDFKTQFLDPVPGSSAITFV
jgi:hypothetical protein